MLAGQDAAPQVPRDASLIPSLSAAFDEPSWRQIKPALRPTQHSVMLNLSTIDLLIKCKEMSRV